MPRLCALLLLFATAIAAALAGPSASVVSNATNHGVGSSLSQTPAKSLRKACNAGDTLACTELQRRVTNATNSGNERGLLCLFYRPVATETGVATDLVHLTALLGRDAPPGVADALVVLAGGQGTFTSDPSAALASLRGYVGPICADAVRGAKMVLRGAGAIGSFRTKVPKGGTLGDARTAFGPPDSIKRRDPLCTARWKALGLRMFFANLGGASACADDTGFFTAALTTNRKWRTANGLAVRQRLSKLRQKFPNASRGDRRGSRVEWWLLSERVIPELGGGRDPRLIALVKKGRIVAFEIRQPNAGE